MIEVLAGGRSIATLAARRCTTTTSAALTLAGPLTVVGSRSVRWASQPTARVAATLAACTVAVVGGRSGSVRSGPAHAAATNPISAVKPSRYGRSRTRYSAVATSPNTARASSGSPARSVSRAVTGSGVHAGPEVTAVRFEPPGAIAHGPGPGAPASPSANRCSHATSRTASA